MVDEEVHPWVVFVPQAVLRASALSEAPEVEALAEGHQVRGTWLRKEDSGEFWLKTQVEGTPAYLSLTEVHRVHPANMGAGNLLPGREVVNRWWGLPLRYEPDDLVEVPAELTIADGKDYRLRAVALEALKKLLREAAADGIEIRVVSAYRSAERQRTLYLNAVARDGITQAYSAPPGHSEHQLGTTVDLVDPEAKELFTQEFGTTPQGLWLEREAGRFGFRRTYRVENQRETGYIPEPWHWRYVGTGD